MFESDTKGAFNQTSVRKLRFLQPLLLFQISLFHWENTLVPLFLLSVSLFLHLKAKLLSKLFYFLNNGQNCVCLLLPLWYSNALQSVFFISCIKDMCFVHFCLLMFVSVLLYADVPYSVWLSVNPFSGLSSMCFFHVFRVAVFTCQSVCRFKVRFTDCIHEIKLCL